MWFDIISKMNPKPYIPPYLLRNCHLNTIYCSKIRKPKKLAYQRVRIDTPDDDFLDLDFLKNGNKRVVVLCHGLEGSSEAPYILGMADYLHQNGWDVLAMNYRTCGGEMNRQVRVYHSGATDDLHTVIEHIENDYDEIALVGFSLGGNLSLVYGGQQGRGITPKIKSIVAISVPTNLYTCSLKILEPQNFLYHQRFLFRLRKKVKLKAKQHPSIYNKEKLKRIKTLYDFDDVFTGPIGGFKDAKDYYTQCSSGQFIPKITIPTLIVNALDDPFLSEESYPYKEVEGNDNVSLLTPKYGGHVGFVEKGLGSYWSEGVVLGFLNGDRA